MPKAGPLPIAEFEPQLKGLIDQLFIANLHFQIGTGLRKSWREYYREVIQAPVFWQYTIHAHDTMAVLGLCRVYDDTKAGDDKCLTLRRLIKTVQGNPSVFEESEFRKRLEKNPHVDYLAERLPKLDARQLKADETFCDGGKPLDTLRKLRNNVVAHLNYEHAIGKEKDYSKTHPLPYPDIQQLIEEGFRIVNRYSGIFIATTHNKRLASGQDLDCLVVLKSLKKLRPHDEGACPRPGLLLRGH